MTTSTSIRIDQTLYDQARAKLETSGRTPEQSLADLLAMIAERGFLD